MLINNILKYKGLNMQYEIVIDTYSNPFEGNRIIETVVLKTFNNEKIAHEFLDRLNENISGFYNEMNVNHKWPDWKVEEFRDRWLGEYEFVQILWDNLSPYTIQNKARIKETP